MAVSERSFSAAAKLDRARKHLDELSLEVRSFLASKPYKIVGRRNPETREVVYSLSEVKQVPRAVSTIAADVLQNLRRSLDHLASELVILAGNYPTRNTGFPIFSSFGIYKAQAAEKVRGMFQSHVEMIDAIKPYKDGNRTLWQIQTLYNIDKHRPLPIVGLAYRFQSVTPSVLAYLRKTWSGRPGDWPPPESAPPALIEHTRRHSPVVAGDVLFVDAPDAEFDERKITFDLAFGEGKLGYGLLLTETLKQMTDAVDEIVSSFGSLSA